MKIQDYLRVLRQRGWIIVLAVVLAAASAFVFSLFQTPVYRASTQVSIQLARPDLSLTQSTKQVLRSYVTYVWSKKYAQQVVTELGLLETAETLIPRVKIDPDESLMVIKIEVDDKNGEQANRIADAWAQCLIDWRNEENAKQNKEDRVFAYPIDPADYHQTRPNTTINVAAGAIFGFVVGIIIVFILEWLEAGIVYNPKSLEQETGLTVLGVIPPQ
ncbi:MAG: hypothetical protein JXA21_23695 [Anaerolineae bacterium]|nr:hypothetical protein [Anaerolineae bacterium]